MEDGAMKDMATGSPGKLILGFFLPMVFGMLVQQTYIMVDTIIVGKYLGVDALAAVGSTSSVNSMIIGFCLGICNGFAIPVAQKFGEKNFSDLRRFVANGAYLVIAFSAVMTVVTGLLCRQILLWMNTPANIIDGAYDYIFIIFMGIPAAFLFNLVSGILRSMGDSRTPLIFLVISSFLNVFLDLYLIIGLNMGVAGAGWATVISQAVSGLGCLIYMKKKFRILKMSRAEVRADRHIMMILCNMGIPMGLQYSITALGSIIIQTAVNGLGSTAVAAVTAGSKISTFFCCPFDAIGSTMATYGGQNIGAGKLDRIHAGLKSALRIGFGYSIFAFVFLYLFSDKIALLFMDAGETEILSGVRWFLLVNAALYIPLAMVNIFRFLIQGMGYTKLSVLAGVSEMAARSFVGLCLVPFFGYAAVCFSNPSAWIAADLFLIPSYFKIMKKLRRQQEQHTGA